MATKCSDERQNITEEAIFNAAGTRTFEVPSDGISLDSYRGHEYRHRSKLLKFLPPVLRADGQCRIESERYKDCSERADRNAGIKDMLRFPSPIEPTPEHNMDQKQVRTNSTTQDTEQASVVTLSSNVQNFR